MSQTHELVVPRIVFRGPSGMLRASSPFIELDCDNPIDAEILALLVEGGEIEIEFDTIGRHLKLLGADRWLEYRDIWCASLLCALCQRETQRGSDVDTTRLLELI